jgi:hypothetical protein
MARAIPTHCSSLVATRARASVFVDVCAARTAATPARSRAQSTPLLTNQVTVTSLCCHADVRGVGRDRGAHNEQLLEPVCSESTSVSQGGRGSHARIPHTRARSWQPHSSRWRWSTHTATRCPTALLLRAAHTVPCRLVPLLLHRCVTLCVCVCVVSVCEVCACV